MECLLLRQLAECCFFFQAEDGIRDYKVTGVQTCALPIYVDAIQRLGSERPRNPARRGDGRLQLRAIPFRDRRSGLFSESPTNVQETTRNAFTSSGLMLNLSPPCGACEEIGRTVGQRLNRAGGLIAPRCHEAAAVHQK